MLKYNREIKKIYIIINKKNVRRKITKTKKDKLTVGAHGRPPKGRSGI